MNLKFKKRSQPAPSFSIFLWATLLSPFAHAADVFPDCAELLAKLNIKEVMLGSGASPEVVPRFRVAAPEDVIKPAQKATEQTRAGLSEGLIDASNPLAYRNFHNTQLSQNLGLKDQAVLFVDTQVTDIKGKSLNEHGATLDVDHHGIYARENPMENSGAQVVNRLEQARREGTQDGVLDVDLAVKKFLEILVGDNASRVLLSSDNLADSAEVMALIRNKTLQERIIANPQVAELIRQAGLFTDFRVFSGDAFEKATQDVLGQKAIELSKAIMHQHSKLLQKYGISSGDRVVGLPIEQQRKLLVEAARASEKLLLEATEDHAMRTSTKEVARLAKEFDAWRGSSTQSKTPEGKPTSFAKAFEAHYALSDEIPVQIFNRDLKESALTGFDGVLERTQARSKALKEAMFVHNSINTGHVFADWAASPMANAYHPDGRRPLKLELGGATPDTVGAAVIVAKSGPPEEEVDVTPYAEALERANQAKKKEMERRMLIEGHSDEEIEKVLSKVTSIDTRGKTLMFNFGGHLLSKGEIEYILAKTALEIKERESSSP